MGKRMVGYFLMRAGFDTRYFCGTKPTEVAEAVRQEVAENAGLRPLECGDLTITATWVTQAEIDAMEEFTGW